MIPSVDERLASVIRALTDVVLPSLPPEAGLAQEQVQLTLGHLQIIKAQLDATPAFEAEELADAVVVAERLRDQVGGDAAIESTLANARAADTPAAARAARVAIHQAVADLIAANAGDPAVAAIVIAAEEQRVPKDRAWFAPFGFEATA